MHDMTGVRALSIACLIPLTLGAQRTEAPALGVTPAFPSVTQYRQAATPKVPYTPAELNYASHIYGVQMDADQRPDIIVYPKDSIQSVAAGRAREWIRSIPERGVTGLQLDPYGLLHVTAGADSLARRAFAARLATPGMSRADSAYTLMMAIRAFADVDYPARMPVAEAYMTQLARMPGGSSDSGVSWWQFIGHQRIANAYFARGNTQATIMHAERAFATLPSMFYYIRGVLYGGADALNMYLTYATLLINSGDTVRLKKIDQQLLALAKVPDSLVAEDSSFVYMGRNYLNSMKETIRVAALLGTPAPHIRGTSWLNVADTAGHDMRTDDGLVRIIGLGTQRTGIKMLPAFARLTEQFGRGPRPLFQAVYLIPTVGFWGSEFNTPAQESANLRQYFTSAFPSKIPIAIWAGQKVRNRNGGEVPAPSPTIEAFTNPTLPFAAIIDRRGRIRHVFSMFTRQEEVQAASVIRTLLDEATPSTHASTRANTRVGP
jgi:hypothetical protein